MIKNTGEVPLTNIEVVDGFDSALLARPRRNDYQVVNGQYRWSIARLEVGATEHIDVECQCIAPRRGACRTTQVSADSGTSAGVISKSAQQCLDIEPSQGTPGDDATAGGDVVPGSPPGNTGLRMELTPLFGRTVRAGTRATFQIVVHNNSPSSDQQVQLRVLFPVELAPDVANARSDANVQARLLPTNELLFDPILQVRPNERLEFVIPVNVNQQGVRNVIATLTSNRIPEGTQQTKEIEILGR